MPSFAALSRCAVRCAFHWFIDMRLILAAAILLAAGLSGCTSPSSTAGSCGLGLAAGSDNATMIRAVLEAEGKLVVAQAIDDLMALWAEDAFVANAKNTAHDASDDQFWRGKDAIRHRYVRTVFPGAPAAVAPAELAIELDAGRAVVTATTRIGNEVAPAGDRWTLVKQGDCWLIESLTYNLESL